MSDSSNPMQRLRFQLGQAYEIFLPNPVNPHSNQTMKLPALIKSQAAFTLPEVMISLFLAFGLIAGALTAFSYQQRIGSANRMINEMNQNVRTAVETLSRELRLTGYGLDIVEDEFDDWVTWVRDSKGTPINMTTNPFIVEGGSGEGDMIFSVGAFDPPQVTLSAAAVSGATTISITGDTSEFSANGDYIVYIGRCETARVTGSSGGTLTISTAPTGSKGLKFNHVTGSPVEMVKAISFEWVGQNEFAYPREPHLIRNDVTKTGITYNWQRMLTSYIEDIQYTLNDDNTITIEVSGRTADESLYFKDEDKGDGYRRTVVTTRVKLRNL